MVTEQELLKNLSVSIFLFVFALSDLNENFIECLPDIPFGIAITIRNIISMVHFKHNIQ